MWIQRSCGQPVSSPSGSLDEGRHFPPWTRRFPKTEHSLLFWELIGGSKQEGNPGERYRPRPELRRRSCSASGLKGWVQGPGKPRARPQNINTAPWPASACGQTLTGCDCTLSEKGADPDAEPQGRAGFPHPGILAHAHTCTHTCTQTHTLASVLASSLMLCYHQDTLLPFLKDM